MKELKAALQLVADANTLQELRQGQALTVSQIRLLLWIVLPVKPFGRQETIDLIKWVQIRNHRAYISHLKKMAAG